MLYAGDIDMACNFIGIEHFAAGLNRTIKQEYVNWRLDKVS